jgi:hypothetical protein
MSGKLLLKLEVVSLMLQHHTSSAFHFLDHPVNGRNRWAGAGSCSGGGGGGGAGRRRGGPRGAQGRPPRADGPGCGERVFWRVAGAPSA